MAYYIDSNDLSSGTVSNGTWNFSESIPNGYYKVLYQSFTLQDFPWMWSDCNNLVITTDTEAGEVSITVTWPTYIGLYSSMLDVRTAFSDIITPLFAAVNPIQTVEYDSTTNVITISWTNNVNVLWGSALSTFKYVANKFTTEFNITQLQISCTNMTLLPDYLETYLNESTTIINTTHDTAPTFLWLTNGQFLNQNFRIENNPSSLNVSIFRSNVPIAEIPLSGGWKFVFQWAA